jgi:hypothetical protein
MDEEIGHDDTTTPDGSGDWPSWTPFEYFEAAHKLGKPRALMEALLKCSLLKLPMPDWVAEAYQDAYKKVTTYEVKSWDDAFGKPHPKGTDLKASRKKLQIGGKIFETSRKMIDSGAKIDLELFEIVGKQFGMSCSYARDAYYEHLDRLKRAENSAVTFQLLAAIKSADANIRERFDSNHSLLNPNESDLNDPE